MMQLLGFYFFKWMFLMIDLFVTDFVTSVLVLQVLQMMVTQALVNSLPVISGSW